MRLQHLRDRAILLVGMAAMAFCAVLPAQATAPYDDSFTGTALDTKWTVDDINPGQPGGAVVKDGALVMTNYGAGDDFNDTALFVSQKVSGDFIATLKILTVPATSDDSSTGLMVRQSAAPGDPMVYLFADLIDWREGIKMRARATSGDKRMDVAKVRYYQLPVWVRIVRQGDAFLGYRSEDGNTFTFVGSVQAPMSDPVMVGPSVWAWKGQANGGFLKAVGSATDFTLTPISSQSTPPAGLPRLIATVTDDKGNPVKGAGVVVRDASGKPLAATMGPLASIGITSGAAQALDLFSSATIVPFVPLGNAVASPVVLGYESAGDQNVSVTAGGDVSVTLSVKPLPSISLASDALPATSKGWLLKPDVDSTDGAPMAPDYKEDNTWVSVPVPGDVGGGNPVNNASYFWYRLHLTLPSDWQTSYANHDLVLTVPSFGNSGTSTVAWNGVPVGGVISGDSFPCIIPNSAINWTGDNVIAIMGRCSKGSTGMNSNAPTLGIGPIAGAITGKVKDDAGKPIYWARVLATASDTALGPFARFMDTKQDGSYALTGLPAGTYTVSVMPRQDFASLPSPVQVTVADSKTSSQDFTVPLIPTLDLVKENGYQWLCLDQGAYDAASFAEDHSGVKDPETGFQPWDVSNKNGDWNAVDTNEHIYGWLRLHLTLPADWKAKYGDKDLRLWWFNWDNNEVTYWNGQVVGVGGNWREETGTPGGWVGSLYENHRDYTVPNNLVNWDGDNVIAMHVYQSVGDSGMSIWRPKVTPILPPAPAVMKGDVNGSGKLDIGDVTLALRIAVGLLQPTDAQKAAADVNGDGNVTISDVTILLSVVVGLRPSLP